MLELKHVRVFSSGVELLTSWMDAGAVVDAQAGDECVRHGTEPAEVTRRQGTSLRYARSTQSAEQRAMSVRGPRVDSRQVHSER